MRQEPPTSRNPQEGKTGGAKYERPKLLREVVIGGALIGGVVLAVLGSVPVAVLGWVLIAVGSAASVFRPTWRS